MFCALIRLFLLVCIQYYCLFSLKLTFCKLGKKKVLLCCDSTMFYPKVCESVRAMLQGHGQDDMDPFIDILLAEDVLKTGAESIVSQLLAIAIGKGRRCQGLPIVRSTTARLIANAIVLIFYPNKKYKSDRSIVCLKMDIDRKQLLCSNGKGNMIASSYQKLVPGLNAVSLCVCFCNKTYQHRCFSQLLKSHLLIVKCIDMH